MNHREQEAGERARAIMMWAAGHGLAYTPDDTDFLMWRFPPLAHDVDYKPRDVVHGSLDGRPLLACHLYGRIPEVSMAATVVAIDMPALTIAHESFRHLVERHVAVPNYETEVDAFNEEWEVLSEDARSASALVDQRMIRWIVDSEPPERARTFAVTGPYVMAFAPLPPLDLVTMAIDAVQGFVDHIPRAVFDEYAGDAPDDPWSAS